MTPDDDKALSRKVDPAKDGFCVVRTIGGVQYLFMPDGVMKVPHVAWTRITQDCQGIGYPAAEAVVKLIVVIEDSKPKEA